MACQFEEIERNLFSFPQPLRPLSGDHILPIHPSMIPKSVPFERKETSISSGEPVQSAPAPADNKNEEGKQSKKYIIETDDSSLIKLPAGYSTDDFNEKKVLDYINGKNPEQWETKCENGKLSVYQIFVRNIDYIS